MEERTQPDQRALEDLIDTSRMVFPPICHSPHRKQRAKSQVYYTVPIYDQRAVTALQNLSVSACDPTYEEDVHMPIVETPAPPELAVASTPVLSQKMFCTLCRVDFSSQRAQRQHYKTDWHAYNVKHNSSLTEDEFETYVMNASEMSSISGSDSTTEGSEVEADTSRGRSRRHASALPPHLLHRSPTSPSCSPARSTDSENEGGGAHGRRNPKVYFCNSKGDLLSIFRALLHSKKRPMETPDELVRKAETLPTLNTWAVILLNAGHFAATVFNRGEEIVHKTFHRYVVRAKRGSAQSSRDSQGNAPRSAGANLRRHNEQALAQDIQKLLQSWSDHLKACELIFLRAGNNRGIFFGGKNPIFRKDDDRIRNIPFPCRRSTYNEASRVSQMLTAIEFYASREGLEGQCRERISMSQEEARAVTRPATQRRQHQSPPDWSEFSTQPGGALTSDSSSDKETAVEASKPGRRRAKKQQRGSTRHQAAPEDSFAEERYHFRNQMYTACKTGNVSEVRNLLAIISGITETPTPTNAPITEVPSPTNFSSAELPTPTNPSSKDGLSMSQFLSDESITPVNSVTEVSSSYYPPSSSCYPPSSLPPSVLVTTEGGAGFPGDLVEESKSSQTLVAGDLASLSGSSIERAVESPPRATDTCTCPGDAVGPATSGKMDPSLKGKEAEKINDNEIPSTSKEDLPHSSKLFQSDDQAQMDEAARDSSSKHPSRDPAAADLDLQFSQKSCPYNGARPKEGYRQVFNNNWQSIPTPQTISSTSTSTTWSLPLVCQQNKRAFVLSPLSPISACDILNEPFGDNGTSMLHVAAKEGHKSVVRALMLAGADPALKDKHGKTPYTITNDKETKKEFRRFMAAFPDRYNYIKAQIPSPLTPEMEQERRQKEADRKKEKKKAQKEKMQAKKAEQMKVQKEEEAKQKFLALPDREKRALAAEKRLQQQMVMASFDSPPKPEKRCWKCGVDISGMVPFTYYDYQFCSPTCLRNHRAETDRAS